MRRSSARADRLARGDVERAARRQRCLRAVRRRGRACIVHTYRARVRSGGGTRVGATRLGRTHAAVGNGVTSAARRTAATRVHACLPFSARRGPARGRRGTELVRVGCLPLAAVARRSPGPARLARVATRLRRRERASGVALGFCRGAARRVRLHRAGLAPVGDAGAAHAAARRHQNHERRRASPGGVSHDPSNVDRSVTLDHRPTPLLLTGHLLH